MFFYAQLNENNVCIGVIQLKDEIISDKMIRIGELDSSLLSKKYEEGNWVEIPQAEPVKEQTQLDRVENTLDLLLLKQEGIL